MDGGGKISNLWSGNGTKKDTVHYLIQFATFALVAVLVILVIALFSHVSKHGNPVTAMVERLNNKNRISKALRRAGSGTMFGTEGLTAAQQRRDVIRGLQAQEHMNSVQLKRQLSSSFEHMTEEQKIRSGLKGGLSGMSGQERFINHMPMLGGAKLTDGAVAMRAADPIASQPLSPSQQQYMKENELLEHLLYK